IRTPRPPRLEKELKCERYLSGRPVASHWVLLQTLEHDRVEVGCSPRGCWWALPAYFVPRFGERRGSKWRPSCQKVVENRAECVDVRELAQASPILVEDFRGLVVRQNPLGFEARRVAHSVKSPGGRKVPDLRRPVPRQHHVSGV